MQFVTWSSVNINKIGNAKHKGIIICSVST
jgi:hypothetical protein